MNKTIGVISMLLSGSTLTRQFVRVLMLASLGLAITAGSIANAGTIVRVSTSLGDYSIELLDDDAPITVQNFLNHVDQGDYDQTYFHRLVTDFVLQGGAFRFQPFVGPITVPPGPTVVNEFGVSNTRGTIAMAKVDDDPDSATNQWFINLENNSGNLDFNNGGFTVFGTVLGDGMSVVDFISARRTITLGSAASTDSTPYTAVIYESPLDFVYMNVEVVNRFSESVNVYEAARQLLISSLTIEGVEGALSFNMSLVVGGFKINLDSIIRLAETPAGAANFTAADSRLRFPAIEINWGSTVSTLTNVVMVLSDPSQLLFTLESFDP